ncbi:MAG: hypothetical protein M1305_04205 [Candidatus Marsarchaeota archaeon]|nr:hypothetical protein [Candidatus Marsarchaeota archaeon]
MCDSDDQETANIRGLLEKWYVSFSNIGGVDWDKRFMSRDDRQHFGAFFEIYLYALLIGHGFAVTRNDSGPDFLVFDRDDLLFSIECVCVNLDQDQSIFQARLNELCKYLNQNLRSPDFSLHVELVTMQSSPLPKSAIKKELQRWLQAFDPDDVMQSLTTQGDAAYPRLMVSPEGWEINFVACPRKREYRGVSSRCVCARSSGAFISSPIDRFRKVLRGKSRQAAGGHGRPSIVAVNALHGIRRTDFIEMALFGVRNSIQSAPGGKDSVRQRQNGFWQPRGNSTNSSVSAVLTISDLHSGNLAAKEKTPVLWHNPWAAKPLPPDIWNGPQCFTEMQKGVFCTISRHREGKEAWQILGISPRFPEEL